VSTAQISGLAVIASGHYVPGMDCSVTVYSPGGMSVGLTFTAFSVEENLDCA
jgi:hypothetical protein